MLQLRSQCDLSGLKESSVEDRLPLPVSGALEADVEAAMGVLVLLEKEGVERWV